MLVRIKMLAVAVSVLVAALLASWFGGRKAAKVKELKDYAETDKRMDEVGRLSDADAARDWLHDRGER